MNELAYMIERSAKYHSEQTALICNEELMTFKEVHEQSNALGRGLTNLGIAKGERVAILLPNCSEYVIADFALIKGGFVRVPINNRLKKGEIEYILKDSAASALIYSDDLAELIKEIKSELPSLKYSIVVGQSDEEELNYQDLIDNNKKDNFAIAVTDEDRFQILYTSGTTGKPKGAVTNIRSRKAALNNVFIDELIITPEDAILHVASLAHGGGTKVLPHYIKGATNILMPKFSVGTFFEYVERYKVTTSWMVPTMIAMLLESEEIKTSDYSSLKNIVYAAAPMPVTVLKRGIEVFGHIFIQVYGLSEAPNPDLVLSKYDHTVGLFERPSILRSAGREVTNVRIRIVDKKGNDVPVGQIGEIIIGGDNIMTEYWNLPEATRETIRDGWLYTGDLAEMDENGYIYIIDRQKDMIISGGYNVYPREIEEVLYQHPAILEAAVIGIPDEKWGEIVQACVVLREGASLSGEEVIKHCEIYLANYKKPKIVEFYEELPKNSNGKIQKKIIKREVLERLGEKRQLSILERGIAMGGMNVSEEKEKWQAEKLTSWLREQPLRKEEFKTKSGIPLKHLYTEEDLKEKNWNYLRDINFPGQYPFVRGVDPAMYLSNFWVMGMYSGFGSAEEANARYRYLLEQGQTGFSIALDLPTQVGYDSDHELCEGEVGKVGVSINSLEDIELLFDGVPLEKIRQIRTTANAIGPIAVALFVAYAEKQQVNPNDIKIFLQNDVLKEYIGRGTYIFPPKPSVKLSCDVIEYCSKHLPSWVPIAVCGYHIRDSGSTAVQELAFTLADAIAYIDETISRGISIDDFASKMFTFLCSHVDLLEEVAKFRAVRRLWARLLKEKYGAINPESMRLRIFAYTLGGALTAQQPLNNVVRVSIETLAAVLGGVQTIATSSYDEAVGLPTEEAATVALRTQQIIAEESGVTNTIDPLGGSYAIEALTTEIEEQVWAKLKEIEENGGAIKCIEEGIIQKEISETAYRYQKQIENGEEVIVGVNKYMNESEVEIPVFEVNEEAEKRQIQRLQALRKRRDQKAVNQTLKKVRMSAEKGENVIPAMIEAVKAYATVGEICDVLRNLYGVYHDPAHF